MEKWKVEVVLAWQWLASPYESYSFSTLFYWRWFDLPSMRPHSLHLRKSELVSHAFLPVCPLRFQFAPNPFNSKSFLQQRTETTHALTAVSMLEWTSSASGIISKALSTPSATLESKSLKIFFSHGTRTYRQAQCLKQLLRSCYVHLFFCRQASNSLLKAASQFFHHLFKPMVKLP